MSNSIGNKLPPKPAATSMTIVVEKGEEKKKKERTFVGTGSARLEQNSLQNNLTESVTINVKDVRIL